MLSKMMFRRPQNDLETDGRKNSSEQNPAVPDELCVSCPACRHILFSSELYQNNSTCPKCGHLFRMNARRRIELVADEGSFAEHDSGLQSVNRLEFPDYEQKLKKAKMLSRETEAVVCGECTIKATAVVCLPWKAIL